MPSESTIHALCIIVSLIISYSELGAKKYPEAFWWMIFTGYVAFYGNQIKIIIGG